MYAGASVGVVLFEYLSPAAVAWLRMAGSALVLTVLVRPRRSAWWGRTAAVAGMFGIVTALMNLCFYVAIDRLPLGTAVAIEFLGPIVVVAWEARTVRAAGALAAALVGVVLVAEIQFSAQPLGVVFALLAAAFWAAYILLGKVVAVAARPQESLAVGWVIAALVTAVPILPFAAHWRAHTALDRIVLLTFVLAILSSVIPYRLDQVLFRMVGRGSFALLLALLPASAVLVGFVFLRQVPTAKEIVGIGFVVLAVALNDRRERAPRPAG